MTPYYLIRVTERRGRMASMAIEELVARAIRAMGYDAWAPFEIRAWRPSRKARVWRTREHQVVPKCLFAAVPEARHGDLQRIRYFDAIERDTALMPLLIPAHEVMRFRDYLSDWNDREIARITAGNRGKAAKKAWVKLDPENLAGVLRTLYGDALDAAA